MPVACFSSAWMNRALSLALALVLLIAASSSAMAASIRGFVTHASGAKVTGANVVLVSGGQVIPGRLCRRRKL